MIINGNLILEQSSIESLGDLEEVKGEISLYDCRLLKDLGKLTSIEAKSIRYCMSLETLGKIKEITSKSIFDSWNFQIFGNLISLGNLKEVNCSIDIILNSLNSKLVSLNPKHLRNKITDKFQFNKGLQ